MRLHGVAYRINQILHRRAGVEHPVHTAIEHALHILLRNDAADIDEHVPSSDLVTRVDQPGHEHVVGVAHHRSGHKVHILVASRLRKAHGRLP